MPTRSFGGMLNIGEAERHDVGNVRQKVENDDREGAQDHRAGQHSLGLLDLAAGEGDVVPGRLREERPDHRFSEKEQESGAPREPQTLASAVSADQPLAGRIPPRRSPRGTFAVCSEQYADDDQSEKGRSLGEGE